MAHPALPPRWRHLLDQSDECADLAPSRHAFAIYGAGKAGKTLCDRLLDKGIPVSCFLDRQAKPGQKWRDIPVLPPDAPVLSPAQRHVLDVVVAIFNPFDDVRPVVEYVNSLGYGKVLSFVTAHARLSVELGNWFWLTGLDFYRSRVGAIEQCWELWEDDHSRDLYRSLLEFRASGDYECLPHPETGDQYFPASVPLWDTRPVRYVDGGAFTGETIREAVARCSPVDAVAAFEPDLANYHRLASSIRNDPGLYPPQCFLWPCALWSHATPLSFAGSADESSHVSGTGTCHISGVALDEVIPFFRPTVIKFDIEGAEREALQGARHLIGECHPGLAVSLYHQPGDLWELPLLLHKWDNSTRFFLRLHCFSGFEAVLYALPR